MDYSYFCPLKRELSALAEGYIVLRDSFFCLAVF